MATMPNMFRLLFGIETGTLSKLLLRFNDTLKFKNLSQCLRYIHFTMTIVETHSVDTIIVLIHVVTCTSSNRFSFFLPLYRRSEFLGCLMIPVKVAVRKNIRGTFRLQPKISLTSPSPLIPEADGKLMNNEDR
jgi:hypothetical protein